MLKIGGTLLGILFSIHFIGSQPPPSLTEEFFGLNFLRCGSCQGLCSKPIQSIGLLSRCMCDEYCVLFGDCCLDYYTKCNLFLKDDHILEFMNTSGLLMGEVIADQIRHFKEIASCTQFYETMYIQSNFFSIATCPDDFVDDSNATRRKCEEIGSAFPFDIPVSAPNLPFWTFKNVFCAICHGFDLDDIEFWNADINCLVRNDIVLRTVDDLMSEEAIACKSVVTHPEWALVRACNPTLEKPCTKRKFNWTEPIPTSTSKPTTQPTTESTTSNGRLNVTESSFQDLYPAYGNEDLAMKNLDVLCNAYFYEFNFDSKLYYNPHCYACSEFNMINSLQDIAGTECTFRHPNFGMEGILDTREVIHIFGRYGGKLLFYSLELKKFLLDGRSNCSVDEYFDELLMICRPNKCQETLFPYFGSCLNKSLGSIYESKVPTLDIASITITMNVTLFMTPEMSFTEIVEFFVKYFDESKLGQLAFLPTQNIKRQISIVSVNVIRESVSEAVGKTFIFHPHILAIKFNVSVPFQNLAETIYDFKKTIQSPTEMTVQQFEIRPSKDPIHCPVNRQRMTLFSNLSLVFSDRHILAMNDKTTFDISKTDFVIAGNDSLEFEIRALTTCFPLAVASTNPQAQPGPQFTLNCDSIVISDEHFRIIDGGIQLKNGRVVSSEMIVIDGNKADICVEAILDQRKDFGIKILFRNITSSLSLCFKILAFAIVVLVRNTDCGTIYFLSLALITCSVDIVHLVENLDFDNSMKTCAILLHFSWLLVIYSMLAWCVNIMICKISSNTFKRVGRHFVISLVVPITTIIICSTGNINDPPWNIEYSKTGKLFDADQKIVFYGYLVPGAIAFLGIIICYLYRLKKKSNSPSFFYHALVTGILMIQSGFAVADALTNQTSLFYLYFSMSLLQGWTFLLLGFLSSCRKNSSDIYKAANVS